MANSALSIPSWGSIATEWRGTIQLSQISLLWGQRLPQLLGLHSSSWWAPAAKEPGKPPSSWPAEDLGMRGELLSWLVGAGCIRKLGHARQAWGRQKKSNSTFLGRLGGLERLESSLLEDGDMPSSREPLQQVWFRVLKRKTPFLEIHWLPHSWSLYPTISLNTNKICEIR